jgi:hypothetical protein
MCPTPTSPSHGGAQKTRDIESGHDKASHTANNLTAAAYDRGEAESLTGGLGDLFGGNGGSGGGCDSGCSGTGGGGCSND